MRIALAQLNPIVGDIAGNAALIRAAIAEAKRAGARLVVTSELSLIGYPPRDLLFREDVVESCELTVREIAREVGDAYVLIGHPRRCAGGLRGMRNSVSVCHQGDVIAVYDKRLLPGYDVFDEDRYFDPGPAEKSLVLTIDGMRVGVLVCEDLWHADDVAAKANYPIEPVRMLAKDGCDLLIALNASPFVVGKFGRHIEQVREAARSLRAPVVTVNQVGANDDLIFDGRSAVLNAQGEIITMLSAFEQAVEIVHLGPSLNQGETVEVDSMDEAYHALVLGVRDYFRKTGNERAVIGLSGGIDSALVAVIAAAALGAHNILGVLMPSRYSSPGSVSDARDLVRNLAGAQSCEIPIHLAHEVMQGTLDEAIGNVNGTLADENLQARLRGLILMAISNATPRSLLISTSNKSEIAAGYSTLYGDMCGAISPLGDLTKTRVYALSQWINHHHHELGFTQPPIPQASITKPPSAELRPNQTDQDTLPPYPVLDEIIERYIEREQSVDSIIEESGIEEAIVCQFTRLIDLAQYKREQASVILKITPRAFGRGRVMPIVMKSQSWHVKSLEARRSNQRANAESRRPG
ncbi:MAG TPA: NAD+ synthase [Phycisphaerales bacterium]|nr:NAD+ synthase [Phycisphaerales bacterium]HRQ75603.1 NAD+ synthase [Phycisphaerales bacterium]